MEIQTNCSLGERNSFGIEARASRFVEYDSVGELQAFLWQCQRDGDTTPLLHFGRGSNLLLLGDVDATVLHSRIRDVVITADEADNIYVRVGAGALWDAWLEYAIDSGWYGLENLSLIPGEVGASAVQNIGAYGVEAKDRIIYVDAVDLQTAEVRHFTAEELAYGYRTSRFKTDLRGRYAVTYVHFRLSHSFRPQLGYSGLTAELARRGIAEYDLTAHALRQIIIDLRRQKLPDPAQLGNAGSFFKNPVVQRADYDHVAAQTPGIEPPHYDLADGRVKIPAAWLIEQTGWKGRSLGKAAVYERQALVLVNTGGATGADILALCRHIQDDVKKRFGIILEPEVNFIGTTPESAH